jgi:ABC-type uncharacterized transport system involved in gliding motility auxiliary subunit
MAADRSLKTSYGVSGLVALAVGFVGVIMLANFSLRGVRLDLTQNHLYTLSPGTAEVLSQIKEPVNLTLYFSRTVAAQRAPTLLPYAARVREFLEELAARSGGKLRLQVIDPAPFSDDEERANRYGVQPLPTGGGGENLYFGLVGSNATDGRAAIPAFQADREAFLEYDVAKVVHELTTTKKPVIGLISSFDMQGETNEAWPVLAEIEQLFTVRTLGADSAHIDDKVDVLMIVHPRNLPTSTLYAIDQFVMRGGRVLLFIDPNSGAETDQADPNHSSNLQPLLSAWGVGYDPGEVIGDTRLGLEVHAGPTDPPLRHIAILGLHRGEMNAKDVVTGSLDTINMATVGYLRALPGATTVFEALLQSSADAAPIPVSRFVALADPETLRDGFKPTGIRYALAARITGNVQTAYPAGQPGEVKPVPGPPLAHLTKTSVPANIVVVADTDLLLDFMWVQMHEVLGQRVAQTFANNGDFVANILDNLAGSGALISIRGRAGFDRPFERIEALKRSADEHLRAKAVELQTELKQTETRLAELQSKRDDQASASLSPDQEREIKRFTAERGEIRKQLRETQRGLDLEIDHLESRIKFLNIVIMPVLVALAGCLALAWRRRRKPATDASKAQA